MCLSQLHCFSAGGSLAERKSLAFGGFEISNRSFDVGELVNVHIGWFYRSA